METKTKKVKNKENIAYRGNVKIKVVRNNKVVKEINTHNEGSSLLFNFLAYCLAGKLNESERPNYIHLFNTKNEPVEVTTITTPSTKTRIVTIDDGYIGTEYTFVIPAIYIKANKIVTQLRLYGAKYLNSINDYSAKIDLNGDEQFSIDSSEQANTSILITYTLVVANVVESED